MPHVSRASLATVFVVMLIDTLNFSIVFPLLPSIAKQFNASATLVGTMATCYALCQMVATPILGRISDRFGRRPVLLFSLFGKTCTSLGAGLAWNFPVLVAARCASGISGGTMGVVNAYIADVTTKDEKPVYMSYVSASNSLGMVVGPVIGGLLSKSGFAMACYVSGTMSALNFFLALATLLESRWIQEHPHASSDPPQNPESSDARATGGTIATLHDPAEASPSPAPLLSSASAPLSGARTRASSRNSPGLGTLPPISSPPSQRPSPPQSPQVPPTSAPQAAAAAAAAATAAAAEAAASATHQPNAHHRHHQHHHHHHHHRGRSIPWSAGLCFAASSLLVLGFAALESIVSYYLMDTFFPLEPAKDAAAKAGTLYGKIFTCAGIVTFIMAGFLYKRIRRCIGEKAMIVLGATVRTAGFFLQPFAPTPWLFAGAMMAVVCGNQLVIPTTSSLLTSLVHRSVYGRALGYQQAMQALARVLGPLIFGYAYDHIDHRFSFFACGVTTVVASILILCAYGSRALKPVEEPPAAPPETQILEAASESSSDSEDEEETAVAAMPDIDGLDEEAVLSFLFSGQPTPTRQMSFDDSNVARFGDLERGTSESGSNVPGEDMRRRRSWSLGSSRVALMSADALADAGSRPGSRTGSLTTTAGKEQQRPESASGLAQARPACTPPTTRAASPSPSPSRTPPTDPGKSGAKVDLSPQNPTLAEGVRPAPQPEQSEELPAERETTSDAGSSTSAAAMTPHSNRSGQDNRDSEVVSGQESHIQVAVEKDDAH